MYGSERAQWKSVFRNNNNLEYELIKSVYDWLFEVVNVNALLPPSAPGRIRSAVAEYGSLVQIRVNARSIHWNKFLRTLDDALVDAHVGARVGEAEFVQRVMYVLCGPRTTEGMLSAEIWWVGESDAGVDMGAVRFMLTHNTLSGAVVDLADRNILHHGAILSHATVAERYSALNELRSMMRVAAVAAATTAVTPANLGMEELQLLDVAQLVPPGALAALLPVGADPTAAAAGAGGGNAGVAPPFEEPAPTGDHIRDQQARAYSATQWVRRIAAAEEGRERLEAVALQAQIRAAVATTSPTGFALRTCALAVLARSTI